MGNTLSTGILEVVGSEASLIRLGGNLTATSTLGAGSTFVLALPRA